MRFWPCPLQAPAYWRLPYRPLLTSRQLVEFVILDIEPLGPTTNRWALAEAQVIMEGPVKKERGMCDCVLSIVEAQANGERK